MTSTQILAVEFLYSTLYDALLHNCWCDDYDCLNYKLRNFFLTSLSL